MKNNTNIIVNNDNKSHTIINLIIDNSGINHPRLNKFIAELHDLSIKYSLIIQKEGELND